MSWIIGGVLSLAAGIYIGLGWPGLPFGRDDRVLPRGMRRKRPAHFTPLDWLKKNPRHRP